MSDDFWTPRELFLGWHREFDFTIDAFADEMNAQLPRFWTKQDDALEKSWAGERVWANPPFSRLAECVTKAADEVRLGTCRLVAMLMPANRTEQPFWQTHIEPHRDQRFILELGVTVETRFLPGRIWFGFPGDPTGKTGKCPTFGCVLVIFRAPR